MLFVGSPTWTTSLFSKSKLPNAEYAFTDDQLREFWAGWFREWYGNDYSDDFKTCFNPDKKLIDATEDAVKKAIEGTNIKNSSMIADSNNELYNLFANYDGYWGTCKD